MCYKTQNDRKLIGIAKAIISLYDLDLASPITIYLFFDIGFFVDRFFCRLGCEINWTKKPISTVSGAFFHDRLMT